MQSTTEQFSSKAAGSLMLFGEHAVLHGASAIVGAVNQFIEAKLIPRYDSMIGIYSDRVGNHQTSIKEIEIITPFEFVLTAIKQVGTHLKTGFDLYITSEFACDLGLGSSAAVTVATLRVLSQWLNCLQTPLEIYQAAHQVIMKVQGAGSGADVAAATFGGVIAYGIAPFFIQPLPVIPDIALVYCGYKTPTKQVIAEVSKRQAQQPQLYAQLYSTMDRCTQDAIIACQQQNWSELGQLMNVYQGLLEALGVSTADMNILLGELRQQRNILGAKISGSGLGDCIWGLGALKPNTFPQNEQQKNSHIKQIDLKLTPSQDMMLV